MKNGKTHEHRITRRIPAIGCVTTLAMAFTLALPLAAHAQSLTPPSVPPGLEVDAPNQPFLLGHGVGTQNYECQPVGPLGRVDWVLFTPQANLFDDHSDQLITHFASPNPDEPNVVRVSWQDSRDTSAVWARAVAVATVNRNAIPWVKLLVVGRQDGPTGGATLSRTTFIQRVDTEGGLAPTTGCEVLSDVGHRAFIPYTAEYFFYRQ